jgi:hypothetical protein
LGLAPSLQLDVTDRVSIADAVERIREEFGRLDLLVQNITSLIRHFEDLRDGTHGGSASRKDKEVQLAVERIQRGRRGGPAIDTSGDRFERSAQSRLPLGLSDRSCDDGKSRQPARPWSPSNVRGRERYNTQFGLRISTLV